MNPQYALTKPYIIFIYLYECNGYFYHFLEYCFLSGTV